MEYTVDKVVQSYPMGSRKTDGSGLRYVVTATGKAERDARLFRLMLEDGGELVGRWFCEEVQGR